MYFLTFYRKYLRHKKHLSRATTLLLIIIIVFVSSYDPESARLEQWQIEENRVDRLATRILDKDLVKLYQPCLDSSKASPVPREFVLAVALTERYNRPALRQRVEILLAQIKLLFYGHLPDYSLGVAQIRPSTAHMMLHRRHLVGKLSKMSSSDILRLLADRCNNLIIADEYIQFLARGTSTKSFNRVSAEEILEKYNGQNDPVNWQNKLYRKVVWRIYEILQRQRNAQDIEEV